MLNWLLMMIYFKLEIKLHLSATLSNFPVESQVEP